MFHDSLQNHHLCLTLQLQDTILVLHYSKSQVTHKSRQLVHYSLRWTEHYKITKMHFMQNRIPVSPFSCNLPPANDQDLLHATAGSWWRGVIRYQNETFKNKSQHRKFTMENKFSYLYLNTGIQWTSEQQQVLFISCYTYTKHTQISFCDSHFGNVLIWRTLISYMAQSYS